MKTKSLLISALLASTAMTAVAQSIPTYTKATLPAGISEGFFRGSSIFADVNNDGFIDLIVKGRDLDGGWAPKVQLAKGSAAGLTDGTTLLENIDIYESNITALDYNNDGNIDLLLSCYGTPRLYRGAGDGTFTEVSGFALDDNFSINDDGNNGEKTSELYYKGLTIAADFDNDGYQDILTKNSGGSPVLYHNNHGDGTFTKVENSNLYSVRGGTMAVGDFNNDGLLDVAAAGWSDEAGTDVAVINRNNGDGTFTTVVSENLVGAEKGTVMLADLDGDGLLDLFVTGESCPEGWAKIAYVFKNNGDGTFQPKASTSLEGACKGGADWADVNGDGLIDIIYTGESNSSNVVVAINQGGLSFVGNNIPQYKVARGGAAVEAFDYNGDGIIDLAVMGYNDKSFLTKHFSVWNGSGVTANTAPTVPTGLTMTAAEGGVVLKWTAATDAETPAASLRYNVYVKLNDGSIISNVPADPATGKLRLGSVDAALTATSYRLAVAPADIAEWGVQTIDGGKLASAFAKGAVPSGIGGVAAEGGLAISAEGGSISVSADAQLTVATLEGATVASASVKAGTALRADLKPGVYVVKAVADGATAVKKVVVK